MDSFCLFFLFFLFLFCSSATGASNIGVNWGSQSSHPLPPQAMVEMMLRNQIGKVKLPDANGPALRALAKSGIEVMVGIPNSLLMEMLDMEEAARWVDNNVVRYLRLGTKIRYIGVGNEPYREAYNGTYSASALPALRNIQRALEDAGVAGQVKASIPMGAADIFTGWPTTRPSEAAFRDGIDHEMAELAGLLASARAPFVVNIQPFLAVSAGLERGHDASVDMGAFWWLDGEPMADGDRSYGNAFDAVYDALVVALAKVGYPDAGVVVGEIGWPTDGHPDANPGNASRFNQRLIDHVVGGGGTPRRPIELYLSSLIDEDMRSVDGGQGFERHWGLLRYDGVWKYALALSGSGGPGRFTPAPVPGVRYLPDRWCVLDGDAVDTSALPGSVSYACANADCTPLARGCSCARLVADDDAAGYASYAFNAYFQRHDQQAGACSFDGLGRIVLVDPSVDASCPFVLQVAYGSSSSARHEAAAAFPAMMLLLLFFMLLALHMAR